MRELLNRLTRLRIAAFIAAAAILVLVGASLVLADPNGSRATPPGFIPPVPGTGTPVGKPFIYPGYSGSPPPTVDTRYPNYGPPDQALLNSVAAMRAAPGGLCPPSYTKYHSSLLTATICYPPAWKLVRNDSTYPEGQPKGEGFAFSILLTKEERPGWEVARVSFQVEGSRPFTLLDCPSKGTLAIGPLAAQVCFHQEKPNLFSPPDVGQRIGITIPHALPKLPALWVAVQLKNFGDEKNRVVSPQDQREALAIIASLEFDK